MKRIIRIGDKTTGSGQVQSGVEKMKFMGIGVARINDPVNCPIERRNPSKIVEGHSTLKDNAISAAFYDHRCSCDCTLISSHDKCNQE